VAALKLIRFAPEKVNVLRARPTLLIVETSKAFDVASTELTGTHLEKTSVDAL